MACVINYNNKTYSLEDFKDILLQDSSLVKEVANKSQERLKAIQEVFNSNPELSKVGDVFSYAIYLDTIFPDSKVKDIVYHFSKDKNKQDFRNTKAALSKETDGSIHFGTLEQAQSRESDIEKELFESQWDGTNKKTAKDYAKELYNKNWNELTIEEQAEVIYLEQTDSENILLDNLANIKGGKIYSVLINANKIKELPDRGLNNFNFKDADTIKYLNKVEAGWNPDFSFAVSNSDQIHILGSQQDIEGFKEYVRKEAQPEKETICKVPRLQSNNSIDVPFA